MKKEKTYQDFKIAIETSNSMSEASQKMNLSFSTFKKWAKKYNLYSPNRGRRGFTKERGRESKNKIPLSEILVENSTYSRGRLKNRLISERKLENKCAICGLTEWNNKLIVLHLDHINGINNDNRLENLRLLCPNCHSQTLTYCRNKNKKNKLKKNEISIEIIIKTIQESSNIAQVLKRLKLSLGERNYSKIQKIMETHNIQLRNFKNLKEVYTCGDCGIQLKQPNKSMLCRTCYEKSRRRVERPSYEQLIEEVKQLGYSGVGRKYGVSDNTIRNWIKQFQKNFDNEH